VTKVVAPLENFLNEKKASDGNKMQQIEEMHSAVEDRRKDFATHESARKDIAEESPEHSPQEEAASSQVHPRTRRLPPRACKKNQITYGILEPPQNQSQSNPSSNSSHHAKSESACNESDASNINSKNTALQTPEFKSSLNTQKRIQDLKKFKEKFGHCRVSSTASQANRPYTALGRWCIKARKSRRLIEQGKKPVNPLLTNADLGKLDDLGFEWAPLEKTSLKSTSSIQRRIEELKTFKAEFGHCNVSASKFPANKAYLSLGKWCASVRITRRLMKEGKRPPCVPQLSKTEIGILDDLGFQ